ncbi:MAG TPA: MotA/TolQ/ExbB proton channel family protein [Polyangiales bacterium]|nr:MotA/TolQ/ExbB proton channel family protein [Polyangiales bacterium]
MNTVEAIKHLFLDTGASWVLWMLAALSVVSVAIAIERLLFYHSNAADLRALASELHTRLEQADNAATLAWLNGSRSVAARIAAAGLRLADRGPAAVEKAMLSRTALEREALDRRLAFLGTLGNNAPFIGLFGTVIGVIQAFEELGHSAAGHAGGTGQVASGAVMSAIAEALVATAVGLAVALPAVAAYNYFQRRVEGLLAGAEVLSNLVLAFLSGKNA